MPDPSTEVLGTPTTTPPPVPVPSPAPASPPATDPTSGHVTNEDFSHPVYGAKLKNLYDGLQEKSKKFSEIEKEHGTSKAQLERVKKLFENPNVAKVVRETLYPTQPTAPVDDLPDHVQSANRAKDEALAEFRTELAMRDAMLELGGGDYAKGKTLWEQSAGDINGIMESMSRGDAKTILAMSMELLRARKATTAPTPTAPLPTPVGTVETETSRGAPTATPHPTGTSDADIMRAMLESVGASSPAEFAGAMGAFGR